MTRILRNADKGGCLRRFLKMEQVLKEYRMLTESVFPLKHLILLKMLMNIKNVQFIEKQIRANPTTHHPSKINPRHPRSLYLTPPQKALCISAPFSPPLLFQFYISQ